MVLVIHWTLHNLCASYDEWFHFGLLLVSIFSILVNVGDLYFQAQSLFDADMYLRLTSILHTTIRNSKGSDDFENEVVSWCTSRNWTNSLPNESVNVLQNIFAFVFGVPLVYRYWFYWKLILNTLIRVVSELNCFY